MCVRRAAIRSQIRELRVSLFFTRFQLIEESFAVPTETPLARGWVAGSSQPPDALDPREGFNGPWRRIGVGSAWEEDW